jgi:hypothetical protein
MVSIGVGGSDRLIESISSSGHRRLVIVVGTGVKVPSVVVLRGCIYGKCYKR